MCARYILESVLYWARGIPHGRLPLRPDGPAGHPADGAHPRRPGPRIRQGEKILFGEPWSAHSSPMHRGAKPAGKRALPTLNENIGAFCDATRDLVKGHILHAERPGFVNGGSARLSSLSMAVTGWAGAPGRAVRRPVRLPDHHYLSSHDDWTLWDKLVITMDPRPLLRPAHPRRPAGQPAGGGLLLRLPGALVHAGRGRVRPAPSRGCRTALTPPAALNQLDWDPRLDRPLAGAGRLLPRPDRPAGAAARPVRQGARGPGAPAFFLAAGAAGRRLPPGQQGAIQPLGRADAVLQRRRPAPPRRPARRAVAGAGGPRTAASAGRTPPPPCCRGRSCCPAGGALILGRARL